MWVWPQGQRRFLPTLRVLHSSKEEGFLLGAGGVLVYVSGFSHVEGFKRRALGMDARNPKLGLGLGSTACSEATCPGG